MEKTVSIRMKKFNWLNTMVARERGKGVVDSRDFNFDSNFKKQGIKKLSKMRKKLGYKFRFREEIESHRCWITVCFVQAEDDNFLY